tara:strand:+ start:543 stop:905 length:363 start_codon:yes stop_codon:yes gene_type:complete
MALDNYSDRFAHVSGSYTAPAGGAYAQIIPKTDVKMAERITMQFVNLAAASHTVKVYGTCRNGAGTVGGTDWTQIGDTITVDATSSSMKSISTTGLISFAATAAGTTGQAMAYDAVLQNL